LAVAVNQVERASRAWPILTACANQRKTITYGQLGAALGVHHRAVRYVLGVLQDYCLEERLPPITILVVNAAGRPGSGFIAFDHDRLDEGLEQVYSYKWSELANPFEFADTGQSYETLVGTLIDSPDDSDEVYRLVRARGIKQILFRDALVKAYSKRCAFTQITFLETLEACHIVPWAQSSSSEKLDVRNGVLLNSFHHKLFDRGLMTISTDYRIVYCDPKTKDGKYTKFDRALTASLHGKTMHLPHLIKHRPRKELIERHHLLAGWERHEVEI
jgi:putative restriction endonuclease